MKYRFDHDLHLHSNLSTCSRDPLQTPENILSYAKKNGLHTICLTNHFWDDTVPGASKWYAPQNYEHISSALPLPQEEGIRFLFGCETELNQSLTLGLAEENFDRFDFILIPTTHFHQKPFVASEEDVCDSEHTVQTWIRRFDAVLNQNLPFQKVGLAHLTTELIHRNDPENFARILDAIPTSELERLFSSAAERGLGIELNAYDFLVPGNIIPSVLRIHRVAKGCGCKFFLGSDSHTQAFFTHVAEAFDFAITRLQLTESDKFIL